MKIERIHERHAWRVSLSIKELIASIVILVIMGIIIWLLFTYYFT